MIHKMQLIGIILLLMYPFLPAPAEAVDTTYRLRQEVLIERSTGTRIDREELNERTGKPKSDLEKSKYLERVLLSEPSARYQKMVELMLFEDKSFARRCWRKNLAKGIEFFFSVSLEGKAEDIKWFPNKRSAKCIKDRVESIAFIPPSKTHHSWVVLDKTLRSR